MCSAKLTKLLFYNNISHLFFFGSFSQFLDILFCVPNMTYPVAMEIVKKYDGFAAIMKT